MEICIFSLLHLHAFGLLEEKQGGDGGLNHREKHASFYTLLSLIVLQWNRTQYLLIVSVGVAPETNRKRSRCVSWHTH